MSACQWPMYGPEGNPTTGSNVAYARYQGTTCTSGSSSPTVGAQTMNGAKLLNGAATH